MDSSHLASEFFDAVSRLPSPVVYCTIVGILLACGLGLPIPEDITLLTAGLLASAERISLPGAMIAGFAGVLIGDTFLFFLGRRYGKSVFRLPGFRKIFTPDRISAAEARIRKNGPFICFIARFLPGFRSAIFAMSGALGVRFTTFLALDGLAALLSVPLWVYVGYWFGENFEDALGAALQTSERLQVYIFSGIGVLIVSYVAYKLWRRKHYQRGLNDQLPQV
jgi:membrane protein DedA with SNARE-associated domain